MTDKYELVAGIEIHMRLKTKTKLFCNCSNDTFAKEANTLICPVCAGFPGTLPVVNSEAFKMGIKSALALGCTIKNLSKFDRKSYFYPDSPAGYQISQLDEPIAEGGEVLALVDGEKKSFAMNRVHMENDAGKLIHEGNSSLADWNRAGSPLIEIVSEPIFRSSEEVFEFLKELQRIMRFLDTSNADMEKGMMRCDVNISVRPFGQKEFGTKVEIKNMNSFNNVKKAMDYEFARQCKMVEKGEEIVQETRGWDAHKNISTSQRKKEESADYRYFPEPDLPPLTISDAEIAELKSEIGELPCAKMLRFAEEYKLSIKHAYTLGGDKNLADLFEEVAKVSKNPQKSANWVMGDYMALSKEKEGKISGGNLGKLIIMVEEGKISGKTAKEIFPHLFETNEDVEKYIEAKGLIQISDSGAVEKICQEVVAENPKMVADFQGGKEKAIGGLVGQVMKKSQGKANPAQANEILRSLI